MQHKNDTQQIMDDFFEEPAEEVQSIDIKRYVWGILRLWFIVVGCFVIGGFIGWRQAKKQKTVYEAEAQISFDNIQGNPEQLNQIRIMKLTSRSFAEEVTAKLGLTLQILQQQNTPGITRDSIFTYFSTSQNPVGGEYQLRFSEPKSCHIYYNTERIEARSIQSCIEDTVSFNGIFFKLNPNIVKERDRVDFRINDFRWTVRNLISRTKIRSQPDGRFMKIVMQDGNAKIAAETANLLANILIMKSEDLRRDATRFNREYLAEQLKMVENDLHRSDAELKSFREDFLQGLDQETSTTLERFNTLQARIHEINFNIEVLSTLLAKLDPNSPSFDQNTRLEFVFQMIGDHPVFKNDAEMSIKILNFNTLMAQKNALLASGLPDRNPDILEISEKIFFEEESIRQMAANKIVELNKNLDEFKNLMEEQQRKLARLPEEELRLIRLNRERNANENLYNNLYARYISAEVNDAIPMERIEFIDRAVPVYNPINARNQLFIFWTFGGLILGFGIALIAVMMDKSIRSIDDVSHFLRLKILGGIPKVKFDSYELQDSEKAKSISSQIVTHDYSPTPVGEAYRALRTNLLFSKSFGSIRTIVISSAAPGEGKSFTAANLTITMAQQKSKTLLVDADLRRGVLHNTFNCKKKPGLTNYLTGVASLEDVLQETYIPNLSLISCGSMIPNPSELLGSDRMQKFVNGISKRFDMIVFDSPPLLAASDAVILGTLADGVALVVRSGQTHRDTIKRKLEQFQNVQARVLGAILNCVGVEVAHEGYSYYSY